MLPDRSSAFENAPLDDLLAILLRQFKRPLATRGVIISDADAETLAKQIVAGDDLSEQAQAIRDALVDLVAESEQVLAQWDLTFEQSLSAQMTDIPGWESTAEFLEIANEKANAELRISTGAALLAALGDPRYLPLLRFLVAHGDDPDNVIARRVLALVGGDSQ